MENSVCKYEQEDKADIRYLHAVFVQEGRELLPYKHVILQSVLYQSVRLSVRVKNRFSPSLPLTEFSYVLLIALASSAWHKCLYLVSVN